MTEFGARAAPHPGGRSQGRGRRDDRRRDSVGPEMIERVVQINHVAKVVAGGRRFGFSTIVVVGDGKGSVGVSIGKAKEVPESITKGRTLAMKGMAKVKIVNGTIPHEILGRCGATRVLLRPAVPGTGIIAGKSVRAILEASGIKDIISKTIGNCNAVNAVKATMDGLNRLQLPEEVAELRGKSVGEIFIAKKSRRMGRSEDEAAREKSEGMEAEPPAAPIRRRDQGRQSPGQPGSRNRPRNQSGPGGSSGNRRPDRRPRPEPRPAPESPSPAAPPES